MKKNVISLISGFLIVTLIVIHFYDLVIALLERTTSISFIRNELLLLTNLILLCGIMVYIRMKRQFTNRNISNCLMILGIIRILISLILPRFYGYEQGSIELLALKSINLIDGELFFRGLILLLFAYSLSELKADNLKRENMN